MVNQHGDGGDGGGDDDGGVSIWHSTAHCISRPDICLNPLYPNCRPCSADTHKIFNNG